MAKSEFISPFRPYFLEAASHVLSGKIGGGKVPQERIRVISQGESVNPGGSVLYWMHMNRRWSWNFAIDRLLEWRAQGLQNVIVLETLPFHQVLTDRHAAFVMQGMQEFEGLAECGPFIYRAQSRKCGQVIVKYVQDLAKTVDVLIVDDHPDRDYRHFLDDLPNHTSARIEAIDSCGLIPFRSASRFFPTARGFRRLVRSHLAESLFALPDPRSLIERFDSPQRPNKPLWIGWLKDHEAIMAPQQAVRELPIDHSAAVVSTPGGPSAARKRWREFRETSLEHYPERRNHPDENGVSGMAPYLHFGFISPYEMVVDLLKRAVEMRWSCEQSPEDARPEIWWNLPPCVAEFLDQLVVWRELGLNLCLHCDNYDHFESLPEWARRTLAKHAFDPRPVTYTLEQLEFAQTHDRVWNAAQNELREEGRLHNYLRMLWGKKIVEWTRDPQTALEWMIFLNNKYGLDGSDPNSYTGITWILGRYDRAWGPERPIFGLVRYMSTDNARRKLRLKKYLERYAPEIKESQS
jgi:deoxyribodipyrimidine photo-lyase